MLIEGFGEPDNALFLHALQALEHRLVPVLLLEFVGLGDEVLDGPPGFSMKSADQTSGEPSLLLCQITSLFSGVLPFALQGVACKKNSLTVFPDERGIYPLVGDAVSRSM